ncbi:MAG TPA: hypothetical protein VE684_09595 [Crenalkalicoccus sp.]|nr:hypothetical protein [Crenalkalicoccus sp.]
MLSTNTLIGLAEPATGLGGHRPVTGATRVWEVIPSRAEAAPPQRPLEAVPPQPGRPLPRGSLLDLRV